MNNQTNKIIMTLMILFGSVIVVSAGSFNVDFYISYNDYDYAPYHEDFGMEYYDMNTMLMPYGQWVFIAQIGRVWVPHVYQTWRPYYNGHWIYTTHGPTWIAYEPWGWMTHHYGRWFYYPHYGWCWLPGYEWGPAWVSWKIYGSTIAWIPTPPHHYRYYDNDYYWDYDSGDRYYNRYDHYKGYRHNTKLSLYVAVDARDFAKTNVHKYIRMNHANFKANTYSRKAPDRYFIETKAKVKINMVKMDRKAFRVNGKQVEYFNPNGQLKKVIAESTSVKKHFKPTTTTINKSSEKRYTVSGDKIMREKSHNKYNTGEMPKTTLPVKKKPSTSNQSNTPVYKKYNTESTTHKEIKTTNHPANRTTVDRNDYEKKIMKRETSAREPVYKTGESTHKDIKTTNNPANRSTLDRINYEKKIMKQEAPVKAPVYRNNGDTGQKNVYTTNRETRQMQVYKSDGEVKKKVEIATTHKKEVTKANSEKKSTQKNIKSIHKSTTNNQGEYKNNTRRAR